MLAKPKHIEEQAPLFVNGDGRVMDPLTSPPSKFMTYVKEAEHKIEVVEDIVTEPEPEPVIEVIEPQVIEEAIIEPDDTQQKLIEHLMQRVDLLEAEKAEAAAHQEDFMASLIERLEANRQPVHVTVENSDIKSLLETVKVMMTTQLKESKTSLTEMASHQQSVVRSINETQQSLIETQAQIVEGMLLLTEKVNALIQTVPTVNPIINVPAPVVNVTIPEGKRSTKMVERDENGLINKIIEDKE